MHTINKFVALCTTIFLTSCGFWETIIGKGTAVPVTVTKIKTTDRAEKIITPARFEVGRRATITLPEDATLEKVYVDEGELVAKDQLLFKLAENDILIKLGQLRAGLRELEAEFDKIEYIFRNRDQLLEEGRIDNAKYESLEMELREKESELEKVRLQIQELETKKENLQHRSPIAGLVESVTKTVPGGTITAGKSVITIIETNPMIANLELTPEEVAAVRPGMSVTFRPMGLADVKINGVVKSISSAVDPQTGRFLVTCIVPNENGIIKAGVTAEATIESKQARRFFLLPIEAVLSDGKRHFIFTIKEGIAHRKPIKIHQVSDGEVEVSGGLTEDDLVVVKGNEKLKEGMAVDIWGRK